ncbi:hypothetical protein GCM10011351_24480 [Paraliobacillus quinghaiensis]|uniref:GGDEF domain-containing protein n=1 Tax=Paraliobacillus quinghaiensis TaxID=470815 RepID=A0A917TTF7_9BACI|nr:GGDEF domain-containing protein [Paraliobacillus quinghaiensis]GGM37369.1 hypothetical protein GCM10011351_24480 [Paraliobacillus quinghaiensis]
MNTRIKNTTSTVVKKNLSNKWFIISVGVTIFLMLLLVWSTVHSSRTLNFFENKSLVLENNSGKILLYTNELEMAVRMAAATGDLRWQDSYNDTIPHLNNVINNISELINLKEVTTKTNELKMHLGEISAIEEQTFKLISHGEQDEAFKLVSGWAYTKTQLELSQTTQELTTIMHNYTSKKIAFEETLTSILLFSVFISLIVLILSWYISIKNWRMSFLKIQEKEDEITYLSYHDSLTGLYNRRYFEKELRRLNIKRRLPLTIIICDANNLKELNDTLGHNVGDELLIEIANILESVVHDKGIVSRWGGDEFGIILPNTDAKVAKKKIKLINEMCSKSQIKPEKPSISIGFAVKTDRKHDIKRTFTIAETRMYKKKIALKRQRKQLD